MKRKLHYLAGKRIPFVAILPLSFTLLFSVHGKAQVINEGFEETVWSASVTTSTGGNATAGTVLLNSYSTVGTGSTYNTGSWLYSSGYLVTKNTATTNRTETARTGAYGFHLSNSGSSYLITPLITNGVISLSLYVRGASSTTTLAIYAATTGSVTVASNAVAATGWQNASSITFNSTAGFVSISYSVTGAASSNPCYIKFARVGSEITIDDIVITTAVASPTLNSSQPTLAFGSQQFLTNSASQSFDLSGALLTGSPGNLTVTAPNTDFQVSNDNATWLSSTTIAYSSATLAATPVYVRFTPQTMGAKSGNVTVAGGGASTISIAVSGTGTGVIYNYRSKQTGNWSNASTWEYFNVTWLDAPTAPSDADGTITIQNAHIVTVDAGTVTTDQTTVDAGGTLVVSTGATLSVANGTGADLTVNGSVDFSGSFASSASATTIVNGTFENKVAIETFSAGTGSMTIAAGGTYKINGYTGNTTLSFTNVNFTSGIGVAGSNLYIASGAPRLPAAVLGNVIWNSPAAGNSILNSAAHTISGDFTIMSTTGINHGSGGSGRNLTVSGSLYMQGGIYNVSATPATASSTLTVNGDIIISGGTLFASTTAGANGAGIIDAKGNVNHTAGSFGVGTGITSGTLRLNAAAAQSFSTIGLSNPLKVTIGSAATPTVTLTSDLTINTGATLLITAGSLLINPGKVLTIAGTANFNDKSVTLKSDNAGTASIAAVAAATLTNASNVTIQRYIGGGLRAYRFLGNPFSADMPLTQLTDDIDITGNGSDAATPPFTFTSTNAASAFSYDPTITNAGTVTAIGAGGGAATDPGWVPYTTAAGTVGIGSGFRILIRGTKGQTGTLTGANPAPNPVTLSATGALNTPGNDFAKTIIYSSGNPSYNLIGNPYPSNVNLKTATPGAGANNNFWIFNPHQGTKGGYITYAFGTNDYSLPTFSGFVVQAIAGTGNTITFHEADKTTTDTSTMLRTTNGTRNIVEMSITSSNVFWDRFMLQLEKKGSADYDAKWDANKFANSEVNFYSLSNDRKALAVDVRPFEMDKIIPMGFASNAARNYTLTVNSYELDNSVSLYLRDKYLGTETKVEEGMTYQFSTNADAASQGENRFELAQKSVPVLLPLTASFSIKLSPNPATDMLQVTFSNEEVASTNISITNAEGKTVKIVNAGNVQNGQININMKGLARGNYYVTLSNGKEKRTEKLVIQ